MQKIDVLRDEINKIDEQIINLLDKRILLSADIANLKGSKKIFDSKRESDIISKLLKLSKNLSDEDVTNIYTQIFSVCRNFNFKEIIAYNIDCDLSDFFGKKSHYKKMSIDEILSNLSNFSFAIVDSIDEISDEICVEEIFINKIKYFLIYK